MDAPENKRPRCQDPDVTVIVGSGDKQENFQCYSVVLSFASDVFDAMFSNSMSEADSGKILLPDKDPEEWKAFYTFIDPQTNRDAKLTVESAKLLIPWFHQFQMKRLLKECDTIVSECARERYCSNGLDKMLELLQLAAMYELSSSFEFLKKYFRVFLKNPEKNLSDIDVVQKIIPFCQQAETRDMFWGILKKYVPAEFDCSDVDSVLKNEMLPSLLHAEVKLKVSQMRAIDSVKNAKRLRKNITG